MKTDDDKDQVLTLSSYAVIDVFVTIAIPCSSIQHKGVYMANIGHNNAYNIVQHNNTAIFVYSKLLCLRAPDNNMQCARYAVLLYIVAVLYLRRIVLYVYIVLNRTEIVVNFLDEK